MPTDATALGRLIPFAIQDAFSEPEQLLTAYFHESTVGLGILDTEFRFLAINPALSEMNGVPAAAHLGKTCRDVLGDFADKIEPGFQRILATGQPVLGLELSGVLPTRSEVGHWIENYFPIKDASGRVKQIGVVVVEITEQKKLERSLLRLTASLQQEKDRLQMLRAIDTTLASNPDLPQLLPALTACIGKVVPYDFAGTWLYDRKDGSMRIDALDSRVGEVFSEVEATPLAECMVGQWMLAGTPGIFNHAELMSLPFPSAKRLLEHGLKSICSVPLVTPKGPLGALGLGSRNDGAFSPEDVALLSHAASTIALALENALTHVALRREKERLQVLLEISSALSRPKLDFQQTFSAISACIQTVVRNDLAVVSIADRGDGTVRVHAVDARLTPDFISQDLTIPIHETFLGQCLEEPEGRTFTRDQLEVYARRLAILRRMLDEGFQSVCYVPLVAPRGMLGGLFLARMDPAAFTEQDLDFLKRLAPEVALAVESATTHEALVREKARLQALREIDAALVANLDLDKLLPAVSACLRKAVLHDGIGIHLYDERANTLRDHTPLCEIQEKIHPEDGTLPLDGSIAGQAFVERKTKVLNYAELANVSYPIAQRAIQQGVRSICCVPLITGTGPLGVLVLSSNTDQAFGREQVDLLEAAAAAIAQALGNALAHRDLQQKKARLQALRDIDDALVASLDLPQKLPVVSQCLRQTLPHDHVAVCVYDERAGGLRDYAATSEVKKRVCPTNGVFLLDDSLTGQAFVEGKSRLYNRAELRTVPFPATRRALDAGIRSSCFVPLVTSKGRVGVLTLSSHQDKAFRQEDLEFLEQVAAALAQALQNALAHRALQEEKKRLQVLLNVSTALAANWNVQEAFPMISAYLRRVLRQEYAAFFLLDEKNGQLVRQALDFPLGRGLGPALEVGAAEGPASTASRQRTAMTFSKEEIKNFHVEITDGLVAEGIRTLYCVPLLRPKGPLGVLSLASTREDAFRPDDLVLVKQVAAQLAVALENHRASLEIENLKDRIAAERKYLQGELRSESNFAEIVGQSSALRQTLRQVETVADSDATALILGETGTGKELIAQAIHRMSKRRERTFVKLNCAAIPTGLLESELFGHERGAFTGAISQKIGRLELADKGTLFLDEVGEIPLELQPKLLRVLQDHEFERLGGIRTIKVNLRVVAATNRELSKSVSSGDFRSDLFYRLNVFPIRMPPLRERRDDIPALVRYFVQKYAYQMNRHIESVPIETMKSLINWHWPGNVRELENLIERSVILSKGPTLRVPLSELIEELRLGSASDTLEHAEREHIVRVLRETGGIISGPEGAAHKLGLKRTTLQSKMQRLRITREDYSTVKPGGAAERSQR